MPGRLHLAPHLPRGNGEKRIGPTYRRGAPARLYLFRDSERWKGRTRRTLGRASGSTLDIREGGVAVKRDKPAAAQDASCA